MFHTTTEKLTGYEITEMLGVVRGSSVRAKFGLLEMVGLILLFIY